MARSFYEQKKIHYLDLKYLDLKYLDLKYLKSKYLESKYLESKYLGPTYQVGGKDGKNKSFQSVSHIASMMDDATYTLRTLDHTHRDAIYELFPDKKDIDKNLLKINKIGIYSLTKPYAAEQILRIVERYVDPQISVVINATSGIGGEILNHYDKFKFIYGYELSPTQYDILQHNVRTYKIENVRLFNLDYTQHINEQQADVVMIDPPWGGLDYRKHKTLELKLGDISIVELVGMIRCRIILLKLPANHNLDKFNNPTVYQINNYMIVVITKNLDT